MKRTGQMPVGWANAKPVIETEPTVACAIIEALGMIGSRRPLKTLAFVRDTASDENTRQAAVEALEKLKNNQPD
jgi:hypothetical protein